MLDTKTANNILEELRILDKKLENEQIGIKDYLFWKQLYESNLVHCYSNIIERLEHK